MATTELAMVSGWNNGANLPPTDPTTNLIENIISWWPPFVKPVPLGAKRNLHLDLSSKRDGEKLITWSWAEIPMTDVDTLITTYLGDLDTDSAKVSIRTYLRDFSYGNYNAWVYQPQYGVDYNNEKSKLYATDFKWEIRIVASI